MARVGDGSKHFVFAVIFLSLGGAGVGIGLWGLSNAWGTRNWVEIGAEVIDVEQETYTYTHHRSGGSFEEEGQRIRCQFAFTVDGTRYTGDRYSKMEAWDEYTQNDASVREMNEQLALLRTGSIAAYYNPDDPDESVLLLPEIAPPTVLLTAGLVLLALFLRSVIKWRRAGRAH